MLLQDAEDLSNLIISHYANLSLDQPPLKDISLTYGEILSFSVTKLIQALEWKSNDVFYDLGSGVAKLALQVFLSTSIDKVYAVEIRKELHDIAIAYTKTFIDSYIKETNKHRHLILRCEDFLTADIADATIILLGSPCFSMQSLELIANKINHMKNIRYVLTLKPIISLNVLRFWKALRIHCSWDSALCYIYK